MKRFTHIIIGIIIPLTAIKAQNTTCSSPSGPMMQPGDSIPICYQGYSAPNTGALTQFYTFIATTPNMEVQLTPILGIACSFPNTAINYSNLVLYRTGLCSTPPIATGAIFTGLTVGWSYTWGVTMTPVDTVCVWIAQSCPKILETPISLGIDISYFNGKSNENEVNLEWGVQATSEFQRFIVTRSEESNGLFTDVGTVTASAGQMAFAFADLNPPKTILYYRLEMHDPDGTSYSEVIQVRHHESGNPPKFYPNPIQGVVYWDAGDFENEEIQVQLTQSSGNVVTELKGLGSSLQPELEQLLGSADRGLYFVLISTPNERFSQKVIKQ